MYPLRIEEESIARNLLDSREKLPQEVRNLGYNAAIDRKGLVWGIVTNKPQEFAEAIAASTPAMARCAIVVGSRPGVPLKPAPDGILRALKELALKPDQTLYTGDDRRDIEAGKAAGTSTLLALWGYRPKDADTSLWAPDFTASSPEDIIRLLP